MYSTPEGRYLLLGKSQLGTDLVSERSDVLSDTLGTKRKSISALHRSSNYDSDLFSTWCGNESKFNSGFEAVVVILT